MACAHAWAAAVAGGTAAMLPAPLDARGGVTAGGGGGAQPPGQGAFSYRQVGACLYRLGAVHACVRACVRGIMRASSGCMRVRAHGQCACGPERLQPPPDGWLISRSCMRACECELPLLPPTPPPPGQVVEAYVRTIQFVARNCTVRALDGGGAAGKGGAIRSVGTGGGHWWASVWRPPRHMQHHRMHARPPTPSHAPHYNPPRRADLLPPARCGRAVGGCTTAPPPSRPPAPPPPSPGL
jgi:hypothetical protein